MKAIILFIAIASASFVYSQKSNAMWTEEKAITWQMKYPWFVGCNYIPHTAINQLEMWQEATFDGKTIDKELGLAESIGFNFVRVFLHHKAWQQDKQGFKKRMDAFLSIATKHHIYTMFVFFDDCWNKTSKIGKQADPKPGIHNSGWLQDPGQKESTDSSYFPLLKSYVVDIMSSFSKDKRIVIWDLYNEPGNSDKGNTSLTLLKKVFVWAKSTHATQPITSGIWHNLKDIKAFQLENSDIISFHNYEPAENLSKEIELLKPYKRPLICTEYMARSQGSTFIKNLPILKAANVGAVNWGFVSGKTNTIYAWDDKSHTDGSEPQLWFHDIFRKDGTPFSKEEVEFIKTINSK